MWIYFWVNTKNVQGKQLMFTSHYFMIIFSRVFRGLLTWIIHELFFLFLPRMNANQLRASVDFFKWSQGHVMIGTRDSSWASHNNSRPFAFIRGWKKTCQNLWIIQAKNCECMETRRFINPFRRRVCQSGRSRGGIREVVFPTIRHPFPSD